MGGRGVGGRVERERREGMGGRRVGEREEGERRERNERYEWEVDR